MHGVNGLLNNGMHDFKANKIPGKIKQNDFGGKFSPDRFFVISRTCQNFELEEVFDAAKN